MKLYHVFQNYSEPSFILSPDFWFSKMTMRTEDGETIKDYVIYTMIGISFIFHTHTKERK